MLKGFTKIAVLFAAPFLKNPQVCHETKINEYKCHSTETTEIVTIEIVTIEKKHIKILDKIKAFIDKSENQVELNIVEDDASEFTDKELETITNMLKSLIHEKSKLSKITACCYKNHCSDIFTSLYDPLSQCKKHIIYSSPSKSRKKEKAG